VQILCLSNWFEIYTKFLVRFYKGGFMSTKTYGYSDIGEHAWMLLDRIRVEGFARAIRKIVKPGDVVVDIGTGTGILAVIAAKAGAKKVYALDRSPILDVAKELFKENGVDHIIEIIKGDVRKAKLSQPPNVVVGEMVGNLGIEEDILGLFTTIRKQCTDDVIFIPDYLDMQFAALWESGLDSEMQHLENITDDITMGGFSRKLANRPIHHRVSKEEIMGVINLPIRVMTTGEQYIKLYEFEIEINKTGSINAIGTWYDLNLCEGVGLTTGPYGPKTHWTNMKFPVYPPVQVNSGDKISVRILPKILARTGVWAWEVRLGNEVRRGDSMSTIVGSKEEMLKGLGLKRVNPSLKKHPETLELLALALGGNIDSIDKMVERVFESKSDEYADLEDAKRIILSILDSMGAME
jgi:SAM-dependent methyltransferase